MFLTAINSSKDFRSAEKAKAINYSNMKDLKNALFNIYSTFILKFREYLVVKIKVNIK